MIDLINNIGIGGIVGITVCVVILIGLLIMIIRTILCKKPSFTAEKMTYDINSELARDHLVGAVQIPTISPSSIDDNAEMFLQYREYLKKTYPLIHSKGERIIVNKNALIFHIKCSNSTLLPIAFLAHQDVVPATESGWEFPPFDGAVTEIDGEEYIYGRGTMDMKGQMIATLEAVEYLLKTEFEFKRDLYLCFGYDEELTGTLGANKIVEYMQKNKIQVEFLVDEGGVVLDGSMLGIDGSVALIGNSEKGYIDYALTATRDGGHSSAPVHPTSIEVLSKAIGKLEKNPMPTRWTESTLQLFDILAPYMKPIFKFVCVNRKVFSPVLKFALGKINPAVESVIRTTFAPTMIQGSDAFNTISRTAKVNINCRLLKGDTDESVKNYIKKIVGKDINVIMEPKSSYDKPSDVSSPDTESYKVIAKSISESFDKLIPAPFTFIAGSDAKFYYPVAKHIYRFTPFPIDESDANRIHSVNERVATKTIVPAITFFIRCITNANE
jgi:carboxypeptidase PM20D1